MFVVSGLLAVQGMPDEIVFAWVWMPRRIFNILRGKFWRIWDGNKDLLPHDFRQCSSYSNWQICKGPDLTAPLHHAAGARLCGSVVQAVNKP
jgi:hypothetical protein